MINISTFVNVIISIFFSSASGGEGLQTGLYAHQAHRAIFQTLVKFDSFTSNCKISGAKDQGIGDNDARLYTFDG